MPSRATRSCIRSSTVGGASRGCLHAPSNRQPMPMRATDIACLHGDGIWLQNVCYPKPTPTRQAGLTRLRCVCTVPKDMSNRKAEKDPKPVDFETAMRDLEEIVARLEQGDL